MSFAYVRREGTRLSTTVIVVGTEDTIPLLDLLPVDMPPRMLLHPVHQGMYYLLILIRGKTCAYSTFPYIIANRLSQIEVMEVTAMDTEGEYHF